MIDAACSRVVHAGELDDDLVAALLADLRRGDAELVDAVAHDRDRAVEVGRGQLVAVRRLRLQDDLEAALEVEALLDASGGAASPAPRATPTPTSASTIRTTRTRWERRDATRRKVSGVSRASGSSRRARPVRSTSTSTSRAHRRDGPPVERRHDAGCDLDLRRVVARSPVTVPCSPPAVMISSPTSIESCIAACDSCAGARGQHEEQPQRRRAPRSGSRIRPHQPFQSLVACRSREPAALDRLARALGQLDQEA